MEISERLKIVRQRIAAAERQARRSSGSVQLVAISKTKPVANIVDAWLAGQRHFGESYVQEAVQKQQVLAHFPISWHFVGPLQSNKTAYVANAFSWVHSVDRLKIAKRLNDQRYASLPPLNICLQVNISQETTKSGILPDQLTQLSESIVTLPRLRLRGLMVIPARTEELAQQHEIFRQTRILADQLAISRLDTLSMGMSGDLEVAIAEGATVVRVGTALFGARRLSENREPTAEKRILDHFSD
jgi:pyridoxal phosphate enzyme (YggS family)